MIVGKVKLGRLLTVLRDAPTAAMPVMNEFIERQARVLVSSSGKVPGLVQVTAPFSQGVRGSEAKRQGEDAVRRDIKRVFASASYAYKMIAAKSPEMADAFWYFLKKKDFATAGKILNDYSANVRIRNATVVSTPTTSLHDGARNRKTGRVPQNHHVLEIIDNEASLTRYIRKKQRLVGLLASSIPNAVGSRYGKLSGVPTWVSRHSNSWGRVSDRKSGLKRKITFTLTKRAAEDMQRKFTYVLGYRMAALERELKFLAGKIEKRLQADLKKA